MLSFICFVLFWRYSEETCVGTYPRHSYPLGSQTKSLNFEYFLITGGFPHPPKTITYPQKPARHFWQRIFLLPRSNMLVPWRVNLQQLLLSRLSPDRLQDMALQRPDRRKWRFLPSNVSFDFARGSA